jgi:glycosyltransferase involved in cell wall biosynthesis
MLNCEDIKVSLVVPVYNIEKYLPKNIESLIKQNLNMEIIYVDDGSEDKSAEIIKKYMDSDPRIKLLQKENGGAGSARNFGLKNATGKYVLFIDGDDYIDENSLAALLKAAEAENLDIVQGSFRFVDDKGNNIIRKYKNGRENTGDCLDGSQWLVRKNIYFVMWLYLFRRDYLIDNNLWFCEDIYHEDLELIPRALYFAKRIKAIDLCFYNYVQRQGSFMHSRNIKKCTDLIRISDRFKVFANDNIDKQRHKDVYDFFENNSSYTYVYSLNSAIDQCVPLSELLEDKEVKNKIIFEISKSDKMRHKFLSFLLKLNLYEIYKYLYFFRKALQS